MESLSPEAIERVVQAALAEDIGTGDVTTLSTVPEQARSSARVVARENLVIAGLAVVEAAFRSLSPEIKVQRAYEDGAKAGSGDVLLRVQGSSRALLTAERVALNFLQRLSGIATLTAQFVNAVQGTRARILDTRKTIPGCRLFEKYAVRCGGANNHRFGLFDQVLIKDNHLAALRNELPHPIGAAVRRARDQFPGMLVEVEADTLAQVRQALEAGADIILLDNMDQAQLRAAVLEINGQAKAEASGGVNLATVLSIAETGVDFISVGALTHSARAVDIALDFD